MTTYQALTNGAPTGGLNPWIDSLVWGGRWSDSDGGTTTVGYGFMSGQGSLEGELFSGREWSASEKEFLRAAFVSWEAVANIDFVEVASAAATISYWLTDSIGENVLGLHQVPGTGTASPLYGIFNPNMSSWNSQGLSQGGYAFGTLIHEIGHGIGLAHPHDGGGSSDATIFPGVSSDRGSYGDYNLNQGIFTTMSYNSGWAIQFPAHNAEGDGVGYGWEGTPMALDIAAIQTIYGANTTYASGNNSYALPQMNASGTFWRCIWDTDGIDELTNEHSVIGSTINLNAASLSGSNAGGYVSYANGILGGFTIASGVLIENAVGGSGNDTLVGNSANNRLTGNLGDDTLIGGAGDDIAIYAASSAASKSTYSSETFYIRGSARQIGSDTLRSIELAQFTDLRLETSWFSKTDALTSAQKGSLVELYIASFNRAPDAIGLNYWGGRLYDGMSLAEIARSFFVQSETVAAYPSSMSNQTFVTTVYNNVLSRAPDTEGLNYWAREIDTGSISRDVFLLAIINGAKASSGSATDRQTLANKVAVGNHFAFDEGLNNTTWGIDVMDSVTHLASTVTAANALTDRYSDAIGTGASSLGMPMSLMGIDANEPVPHLM
ncbi:MAG: DUF4214 domain-containing protein [Alphaproteobacteria bacterium]|nr:DUF4214 domain-containing protein [Alphaproteobacteria bacterium]